MSFELTKNEILKEILKSGKDPVYFIDNYARIAHPIEGLIPFKLYDFQKELLSIVLNYKVFILKINFMKFGV